MPVGMSLSTVRNCTLGCKRCVLAKTRKGTVLSRGQNVYDSPVMFIGEAPGREEDETGEAFVGASGKLLDRWIKRMGIENYYITNIVRCRPPNNRKPLRHEINSCIDFLQWEINAIKPKAIVTLGRTAEKEYPQGFSGGLPVFFIYHPSYYIRLGNHEEQWGPAVDKLKENLDKYEEDLKKMSGVMKKATKSARKARKKLLDGIED